MTSLINFRDVAHAHPSLRMGMLYRGGSLHGLVTEDAACLQEMGIKTVIDLRNDAEREEQPDTPLPGAVSLATPLTFDCSKSGHGLYSRIAQKDIKKGEAALLVREAYVQIVASQWAEVLQALLLIVRSEPPVLMHCRHGRDRTGVVEAVVLQALGIPMPSILQSFLLSNVTMQHKNIRDFAHMGAGMEAWQKEELWSMFEAKAEYLHAALSAIPQPLDESLVVCLKKMLIKGT